MARRLGGRRLIHALVAAALVAAAVEGFVLARGGREERSTKDRETLAVEAKAGDFADYWAQVLKLSRRHAAQSDSFRAALDALPGSHLTDREWNAWTAPYRADPARLAARLERAMAEMAPTPRTVTRPAPPPTPPPTGKNAAAQETDRRPGAGASR